MLSFIVVMVPAVFLINGLTKHDWLEALLFAVAVAVGLTPEMLPMIVTVNLAKGAIAMSRAKVIVKRLNAIQNFGAMDVLCTDKTGTLTQDRIILKRHLDIRGEESERVLRIRLSEQPFPVRPQEPARRCRAPACRDARGTAASTRASPRSTRSPSTSSAAGCRSSSRTADDKHILICKGAVEEIFAVCTRYEIDGESGRCSMRATSQRPRKRRSRSTRTDFGSSRSPIKEMPPRKAAYSVADESDLTLLGYIAFLDPPKESAGAAIAALAQQGRAGEDPDRRQRHRHPQDLPRGRTRRRGRSCSARRSRRMSD